MADRGARAKFVSSVCSASLVLGGSGLLKGYNAFSDWSVRHCAGWAQCSPQTSIFFRSNIGSGHSLKTATVEPCQMIAPYARSFEHGERAPATCGLTNSRDLPSTAICVAVLSRRVSCKVLANDFLAC